MREVRHVRHGVEYRAALRTGAGYGIRLSASDRDRYLRPGLARRARRCRQRRACSCADLELVLAIVPGTAQRRDRAVAPAQRTCALGA